jgi:hypothetical protein
MAFRGTLEPWRRASLALMVSAVVVPVALAMITRPALYNSVRHFLFVVPPLAVLGGLAVAVSLERLAAQSRGLAALGAAVFVGLLILPIADQVRFHPYQYVLFNRLSGGMQEASRRYMIDYWGLGLNEASETLLRRLGQGTTPANGRWKVAVCGPANVVAHVLGPRFIVDNDAKGADFAVSLTTYYCARLDAPVLASAEREGIAFARAYDLRGRTVPSVYFDPDENGALR